MLSQSKASISIIMPVFNEAGTIEEIIDSVCQVATDCGWDYELLIVDDGSTDGTGDRLSAFAGRERIQLLAHDINQGKGAAIRTALAVATKELVVIQDADLEYDPQQIDELIQALDRQQADVVFGSRVLGAQANMAKKRRNIYAVGVSVLNVVVRLLYGLRLTDEATCYKLFRASDLKRMELTCERFEFCPEVTAKAARLGLTVVEIPISYNPRSTDEGKKIGFKDAICAIQTLWNLRRWRPSTTEAIANSTTETSASSLARTARNYVLCLACLHLGLLIYGMCIHGPGWDEVGHLPAGLSHWNTGRFDLYRVNPPLVRMIATLPLVPRDVGVEWKWNPKYEVSRPEWDLGKELIEANGRNYMSLLRLARLACLPFSMIAFWIVWRWSNDLFGPTGAMVSVTVWGLSPLILTNGQMMTPDVAAAAMGAVACYTFRQWLWKGTIRLAFFCGLLLGVAELTKFTWLILFAVWPVQWLLFRFILRSNPTAVRTVRSDAMHIVLMFSICVFVINLGYGFEGTFKRLGDYNFYSSSLGGKRIENSNTWIEGNRFSETVLNQVPVPLPENMVAGIDRQKLDFESGFPSYLRGEWRKRGWWYYYLYGLIIKEPSAFVILAFLAAASVFTLHFTVKGRGEGLCLLFPAVFLFAFVSSQTGFNHHLRYVLPSMLFFAIAMGVVLSPAMTRRRTLSIATCILLVTGSIGSLLAYPHSHSYFNIFVGGPRNGPLHLLNSNIHWGQDILLLEDWAKENPEKSLDGVVHSLPLWLGVRELTSLPRGDVPKMTLGNVADGPVPGRYAVSVGPLYDENSVYGYFRSLTPVDRVGHTTFIYEISLPQANQIRKSNGIPLLPTTTSQLLPQNISVLK